MKFYLEPQITDLSSLIENYAIEGILSEDPDYKSENFSPDIDFLTIKENNIYRDDTAIGNRIIIHDPDQMKNALESELDPNLEMILIDTGDWHIIPLENLIAKFNNFDVKLVATATSPEEIQLLANVLELGIDGCLLKGSDKYSVKELLESFSETGESLDLVELEVSTVEKIGNGDRVCVDTVSILKEGEGMLVGSTSAVQFLIQAEVEESGFVNSRPFRVNAGVVASYTLNFDKTNYLSELATGSTVMITDRNGNTRKEFVARVKIERRPLVVVRVKYKEREFPVVLQDAETIKLVTSKSSTRVDKIQPGDRVLCHISEKARHFGMEIDEFIEEK